MCSVGSAFHSCLVFHSSALSCLSSTDFATLHGWRAGHTRLTRPVYSSGFLCSPKVWPHNLVGLIHYQPLMATCCFTVRENNGVTVGAVWLLVITITEQLAWCWSEQYALTGATTLQICDVSTCMARSRDLSPPNFERKTETETVTREKTERNTPCYKR